MGLWEEERNITSGLYIYAHTTSHGMKEFTPAGWKHFNRSQVGLHCAEFESVFIACLQFDRMVKGGGMFIGLT